ncbi:MAG TPA: pitrilysin family protein [Vicinamibacterales bacterium]|nr:pitrilysin family protein [Vicinamibacterales bacterium]
MPGVASREAGVGSKASQVRETILDNGLKVLVQEVHSAPLASVWCWYRVGSRDEGPGLTGVSHWVEHMNFKGTTNIPRDQVKGIIEQFGGSWNGYTWIDQTTYLETASTDALDRMLFIEAERMDRCVYDPGECESERTVIISELQGGENDPEQLLDMEVTATAFKVHPYRHPTIGWQSDLEVMTREDLYGHYKRYYTPANATLVIVGDVETDDVLRRAEREFGAIHSRGTPARRTAIEPRQDAERRVILRKEGNTAYWKAVYHSPAFGDAAFFPLLVADAVLSGGAGLNIWSAGRVSRPQRSSRLYRRLVDGGIASSVHGALLPTAQPFLYSISATVSAERALAAVEDAVLDELDRLMRDGITDPELEKAKAQLRARFVFDMDGVTDIAHQLGYFETIGSWRDALTLGQRLAAVTPAEVLDVVRTVFAPSNRTIGWFEPQAEQCR